MSLPVIWFLVGVACLVLEVLTPGFVLIFFGVGAFAASGVTAVYDNVTYGLATFSVVSIVAVVFLRSRVMKAMQGWTKKASTYVEQGTPATQVGRSGVVSQAIEPGGIGEISLGGSFWRAEADESLPVGTPVEVYSAHPSDELLLRVRRAG